MRHNSLNISLHGVYSDELLAAICPGLEVSYTSFWRIRCEAAKIQSELSRRLVVVLWSAILYENWMALLHCDAPSSCLVRVRRVADIVSMMILCWMPHNRTTTHRNRCCRQARAGVKAADVVTWPYHLTLGMMTSWRMCSCKMIQNCSLTIFHCSS